MNSLHSPDVLSFASDNYAGAHPQILLAAVRSCQMAAMWRLMAMISIPKNCNS